MEIIKNQNKITDIALPVFSSYLLLGGITSCIYLIIILLNGMLYDLTGWFSFILCLVVSVATIVNNLYIIKLRNRVIKGHITFNIYVCLLQIFSIVVDGFQFKYKQGFGIVAYWKVFEETGQSLFGYRLEKFDFNFTFKFYDSNFFLIGIDFVMLFVFLYFLWRYRSYET